MLLTRIKVNYYYATAQVILIFFSGEQRLVDFFCRKVLKKTFTTQLIYSENCKRELERKLFFFPIFSIKSERDVS